MRIIVALYTMQKAAHTHKTKNILILSFIMSPLIIKETYRNVSQNSGETCLLLLLNLKMTFRTRKVTIDMSRQ